MEKRIMHNSAMIIMMLAVALLMPALAAAPSNINTTGTVNASGYYGPGTGLTGTASGLTTGDLSCTDCIGSTEIADEYLFNTGDTATGDYTFDINTLFIDSANDKVGIGTAAPANVKLHVAGGGLFTSTVNITAGDVQLNNARAIRFYRSDGTTTGAVLTMGTDNSTQLYTTNNNITFRDGDSNILSAMTDAGTTGNLYVSGKQGLGTMPGVHALEVSGSVNITGSVNASTASYIAGSQICTAGNGLCAAAGSGNSGWINTTNQVYLANNATNVSAGYASGKPILFVDATSNKVGINTSAPQSLLDVDGKLTLRQQGINAPVLSINRSVYSTVWEAFILHSDQSLAFTTNTGNAFFNIWATDNSESGLTLYGADWRSYIKADGNYKLRIYTNYDGVISIGDYGSGNILLATNNSNQKVGIGTITPTQKLSVNGAANITGGVVFGTCDGSIQSPGHVCYNSTAAPPHLCFYNSTGLARVAAPGTPC